MTAVQAVAEKLPRVDTNRTSDFVFEGRTVISPEMVEDYARATGDRNPIHFDDAYARECGFDGAIAHAGLVTGHVSRVMYEMFGKGTVATGFGPTRLEKPVPVGAEIAVYVRVKRNRERKSTTYIKVDVEVRSNNEVVARLLDINMVKL